MKTLLLVTAVLSLAPLHGQTPDQDPYRKSQDGTPSEERSGPMNLSVCYETFSLPLSAAVKLQKEHPLDGDLYASLVAAVEKQIARQETFSVVRCKSGQHATTDGISEFMYATEYEKAQMPNSVGVAVSRGTGDNAGPATTDSEKLKEAPSISDLPQLISPAMPTAFDTRKAGVSVEIEATSGEDGKFIDLRIVPDHVTLVEWTKQGQGISTCEMPVFESQRISTALTLRAGQPALLGTISRTPISKVDPDSANRVWFAFVNATVVKP